MPRSDDRYLQLMSEANVQRALRFHQSFPQYAVTPLAALHACRLEQVHAELSRSAADAPIGAIARRYGFTNASRFTVAFRRRFGEAPLDVVRRASRL